VNFLKIILIYPILMISKNDEFVKLLAYKNFYKKEWRHEYVEARVAGRAGTGRMGYR
jgi:hypothetical protein